MWHTDAKDVDVRARRIKRRACAEGSQRVEVASTAPPPVSRRKIDNGND
jgi:hypothetical protein